MKEFLANKFIDEGMKFVYHNPKFFSLPHDYQIIIQKSTDYIKNIIEEYGKNEAVRLMKNSIRMKHIKTIAILTILNLGIK